MTIAGLLKSFPRQRPFLPDIHREIYRQQYLANRNGKGLMAWLAQNSESWMHRYVASACQAPCLRILELGAGTLNHLPYVASDSTYDIVEPNTWLYENTPERSRLRHCFVDLSAGYATGNSYSRIISIATLEHLEDLSAYLAWSGLMLEEGGQFVAGIPSEGGFLWWLGWRATTGLGYWLKHRLDYGVLMRHEHVNRAAEIEALVRHFFASVQRRRYPLPGLHLSLYTGLIASSPRADACRRYLEERGLSARVAS